MGGLISFLVWLVGVICCIWCIKDVFSKKSLTTGWKVIYTIGLIIFSWIGLIVYYFFLRKNIN